MSSKYWEWLYQYLATTNTKYTFYDGNFSYSDYASSRIANKMPLSRVGWARRAVEMRANKTHFDTFENDTIGLNEVFNGYHGPEAFNKLKDDILICGVGFLALAGDRVMPFTAQEATGSYDWHQQNISDGIAVYEKNKKKMNGTFEPPKSYVLYRNYETITNENGTQHVEANVTGRPLMTLLTHKSTTKQPFGRSIISHTARDAVIDASRTVRQAMISAYHYNTKVDILLGVDTESKPTTIQTKTGDALLISPNENGQIPQVGEFAQHAMAPFNDTIMIAAKNFCADTKLSLSNLGVAANAPQSPESLEIVGDDLRDDIAEWQKELAEQLKYFAVTLWMHKNNIKKIDENLQKKIDAIDVAWLPIFRADVSKFGDGLQKIAMQAPGIVKQRSIWRNLGLTSKEIDDVIASAQSVSE